MVTRLSAYALTHGGQRRKYGNDPTHVDGRRFDSQGEAARYQVLRILERTGHIRDLECQVSYPLVVNGIKVGIYRCDFRYYDCREAAVIVEDFKSEATITKEYKLKRKLMLACHGIEIREVMQTRKRSR